MSAASDDQPHSLPHDPPTEEIPRIPAGGGQVIHLPQRPFPTQPMPPAIMPLPAKHLRRAPVGGWRRVVYSVTGGLVNLGDSRAVRHRRQLVQMTAAPIPGDSRIALMSLKGGVGKTTTTVVLGAALAAARGDRIIAVDANPDFGTLAQRGPDVRTSTVRDVLTDTGIARYSDLHAHTSHTASGLELLASESDPAASEALTSLDYTRLIDVLHRFYNIILTDCGTGLVHPVMRGVLSEATAVILVTSPASDSVRSTAATLDWLAHNRHPRLAATATVVISAAQPDTSTKDVAAVVRYFGQRVRSVHFIPFDQHLAEGAEVSLDRLKPRTRDAYLGLAAAMADVLRAQRW